MYALVFTNMVYSEGSCWCEYARASKQASKQGSKEASKRASKQASLVSSRPIHRSFFLASFPLRGVLLTSMVFTCSALSIPPTTARSVRHFVEGWKKEKGDNEVFIKAFQQLELRNTRCSIRLQYFNDTHLKINNEIIVRRYHQWKFILKYRFLRADIVIEIIIETSYLHRSYQKRFTFGIKPRERKNYSGKRRDFRSVAAKVARSGGDRTAPALRVP
ncbi:hypothetical protein V1478_016694 [Vespula squamosa]|uniref:Uncharacterized protein n=1 Tax=Vespula squamosa TaxID=30214 RepID=A0ABD2A0I2_VESSQ